MENFVIVALVIALIAIGVAYTVKHFRGKGGCCGSSGYRVRRKKLSRVLYRRTFTVDGMHCVNCKNRVEETVDDIRGVRGEVDLKAGELTVFYAEEVDDALIVSRLKRAGYTAVRKI